MNVTKVTARLAEWITGLDAAAIPAEVRAEAVRTFVNWVGCAVGGATHETADRALAAVEPFSGPRKAPRSEERRVGKECVSTCKSRWPPCHLNKNDCRNNSVLPSTKQAPKINNIHKANQ